MDLQALNSAIQSQAAASTREAKLDALRTLLLKRNLESHEREVQRGASEDEGKGLRLDLRV